MPKAGLVRGYDRPSQILLQRFDEADTAEAGSDHQDPVGFCRALRTHLATEMLDILLERHALGIQVARRDVPPFAAGVDAYMPGRVKPVLGKVGDALRQSCVIEPCGEYQKGSPDLQGSQRGLAVSTIRRDR